MLAKPQPPRIPFPEGWQGCVKSVVLHAIALARYAIVYARAYMLFFIHLESRRVEVARITVHPNEAWIKQIARNVTMEKWGFLRNCQHLLHDRDTKYCESFRRIIESGDVETVTLPARSPNLNAYAERWVKSVKEECPSKLILFGEASLRRALWGFSTHYYTERNHQAKGNIVLFLTDRQREPSINGPVNCRERLGGTFEILLSGGRMSILTLRANYSLKAICLSCYTLL